MARNLILHVRHSINRKMRIPFLPSFDMILVMCSKIIDACILIHKKSLFISYLVQPCLSNRTDASNMFRLQIKMEVVLERNKRFGKYVPSCVSEWRNVMLISCNVMLFIPAKFFLADISFDSWITILFVLLMMT